MTQDTSSQGYHDLKTELRSILISSQQGCNEQQLLRDYAEYNGRKEIPFRTMGYRNLIELLISMPDVARFDQSRIPVIIHGVANQSTEHIKKFVAQQKPKKKPARNSRGGINRYNGNNSFNRTNVSSTYPRNRPTQNYNIGNGIPFQPYNQIPNVTKNPWNTSNIQNIPPLVQSYTTISYSSSSTINKSVQNSNHQTPNGINQSLATKTVASFPPKSSQTPPLVPTHSALMSVHTTPTMDDNSSVIDDDCNYSEDEELASYDQQQANEHGEKIVLLRKRFRQVLLTFPTGLWLSSVHKIYKKTFKEELNLEEFQLKNLMAFFDCVADFVDSQRDRLPDSTDRILLLKTNFTEAVKREQHIGEKIESNTSLSSTTNNQNTMSIDQNSLRLLTNDINRPIVDLSSFVSLDFHYKRLDYTVNKLFNGFLGDVEDPWIIHIGNVQFIPNRDRMMTELQDHYEQSLNQSIYVIPFEQLEINLSCVYYHTDNKYYRSYIMDIEQMHNHDIVILKIYLVDYGIIISDINYHINSTNLKFLHKNFSSLSTQVYDCRLANVHPPIGSSQWSDDARQLIINSCPEINFSVQIIGFLDSSYCVYIWIDQNQLQSINRLLIQSGLAIESHDSQYSTFESISPEIQSNVNNNNYIDEKLLSRHGQNNIEYNLNENNLKHFIISIEHAYYFVKHPFTKRPCLPCFELARLLNKDETYVSQLNLIRETELPLSESNRTLFNDLRNLIESSKCPHLNRSDHSATIKLYDLSSIRDHLFKIKFKEGDVIDAFQHEYDDYERPGYWNEKKNSYINKDNFESHQENLHQRKELLNFRRDQLVSLSKTHHNLSSQNELQELDQDLNHLNQEIHSMETILPSSIEDNNNNHKTTNSTLRPSSTIMKSSNNKMRETLYRIARPFDQQFSLNIRFDHQSININNILADHNDEIEERFRDLYRITKNVIQLLTLELEISDENNRQALNEVINISPELIEQNLSLNQRIDIYNYCLEIIEYFQPTVRYYAQRTDLIDII